VSSLDFREHFIDGGLFLRLHFRELRPGATDAPRQISMRSYEILFGQSISGRVSSVRQAAESGVASGPVT
jgi:hypothetical protein